MTPVRTTERAPAPASLRARVWHRRTRPFEYAFEHRTTMWLVDAAEPDAAFPRWLRGLATIRAADHFAPDDDGPLLAKVRGFLAAQDLAWRTDRVLVLANARSLGHVFDPLTTYFCFDADGVLQGVLAEVHNTYGERHCYPLSAERPAAPTVSRDRVHKEFYVSPFFAVEGRYDIHARLDSDEVSVTISLTAPDERPVFAATVQGDLEPATTWRTLRRVAANPAPSLRVAALIRWHGIRLWLRRLPVVPRPRHQAPEGMRPGAAPPSRTTSPTAPASPEQASTTRSTA